MWVGIGAGAVALGPLVGGLLIDAFGWRSIFLINLPVGVVSVLLGRISISETPRRARRVDRFGQVTAVIAMGLVTAAVIHGGESGWKSPLTIGMLLAGLLVGAAFWIGGGPHPLSRCCRPRSSPTACAPWPSISAALMGFLFYGTLFLMSLYFQQLRGWSPGSTGVALLPLTVGTLAGPFLSFTHGCPVGSAIRCCWLPASPAALSASPCSHRPTPTVRMVRSRSGCS